MRFNLKNRPKTCSEEEVCIADFELEKWFEGFEKELREHVELLEDWDVEQRLAKRFLLAILGE